MISFKVTSLLVAAGLAISVTPPASAQTSPKFYGDNLKEELGLCIPTRTEQYLQYKEERLTDNFDDLQKFEITEDWRTQGLETAKIPLSVPVRLANPITGETVGVFDRNWKKALRVSSFWGRNIIRIRIQTKGGSLFPGAGFVPGVNMIRGNNVLSQWSINALGIKNKDGYMIINGCDGVFNVTKEVADALVDYPLENNKAFILLSNDGSTGLRINEIGPETVKAWKVVYRDWNPAIDGIKRKAIIKEEKTTEAVGRTMEERGTPKGTIERMMEERGI